MYNDISAETAAHLLVREERDEGKKGGNYERDLDNMAVIFTSIMRGTGCL